MSQEGHVSVEVTKMAREVGLHQPVVEGVASGRDRPCVHTAVLLTLQMTRRGPGHSLK